MIRGSFIYSQSQHDPKYLDSSDIVGDLHRNLLLYTCRSDQPPLQFNRVSTDLKRTRIKRLQLQSDRTNYGAVTQHNIIISISSSMCRNPYCVVNFASFHSLKNELNASMVPLKSTSLIDGHQPTAMSFVRARGNHTDVAVRHVTRRISILEKKHTEMRFIRVPPVIFHSCWWKIRLILHWTCGKVSCFPWSNLP